MQLYFAASLSNHHLIAAQIPFLYSLFHCILMFLFFYFGFLMFTDSKIFGFNTFRHKRTPICLYLFVPRHSYLKCYSLFWGSGLARSPNTPHNRFQKWKRNRALTPPSSAEYSFFLLPCQTDILFPSLYLQQTQFEKMKLNVPLKRSF